MRKKNMKIQTVVKRKKSTNRNKSTIHTDEGIIRHTFKNLL